MKSVTGLVLAGSLLGFMPVTGFADQRGNGGDIVFCPHATEEEKKILVLDYYEAETRYGIKIDTGSIPGNEWEKARGLIDRIRAFDSDRADLYQGWLSTFWDETLRLENSELTDVPDSQHIALPKGCHIVQLIIQKEPDFEGEHRYTLSLDYWNEMSSEKRAGMILHELIYREAKQKNSIRVRYFNGRVGSYDFHTSSFDLGKYISLLAGVEMEVPKIFKLGSLKFARGHDYRIPRTEWNNKGLRLNVAEGQRVTIGDYEVDIPSSCSAVVHKSSWHVGRWDGFPSVMRFSVAGERNFKLKEMSHIYVYQNGKLRCGTSDYFNQELIWSDGSTHTIPGYTATLFDEKGLVVKLVENCPDPL